MAFVFFPHSAKDAAKKPSASGISTQNKTNTLLAAPEVASNLSSPSLSAKAAIAFDLDSGTILYSKNMEEKLPIASLTKLMTALLVVKHGDLNDEVTVKRSQAGVVGSTMGLVANEKMTVGDLLKGMLISSSNDAALVLSDFIAGSPDKFVDMMNNQALFLGLKSTRFANPVGWDSEDNYSNTLDLIKIVREFLEYPQLVLMTKTRQTVVTSIDGKYVHQLRSTNKLLLENSKVIGLKTGFTSKALGSLIVLYDHNGAKIATVVLDSNNREDDTQKLLDWVFDVYKW